MAGTSGLHGVSGSVRPGVVVIGPVEGFEVDDVATESGEFLRVAPAESCGSRGGELGAYFAVLLASSACLLDEFAYALLGVHHAVSGMSGW